VTRLRVAVVAPCGYPTTQGSQVYIRGTARALADRGHDVRVLTYHYGEDGVPDHGVPVRRIRGLPGYRKLRAGPSAVKPVLDAQLAALTARVVRDEHIDVVHAHNVEAPFVAWPARVGRRVPVVQHVHMLAEEELPTFLHAPRGHVARVGRWIDRAVPALVDALVVLSERARRRLGGRRSVHLIPPAVDRRDFGEPATAVAGPVVVYAGNPDAYQQPETLLDAFARVRTRRPDAVLRLVSGASMDPWVRAAVRRGVPRSCLEVVPSGSWEETRAALADAAVGVVPRDVCAGFPIKLLNYMAVGLPAVVCAGSAGPVRDGVTGLVVSGGDARAFAGAIECLLGDSERRVRMGRAARSSVFSEHTWSHRAAAYDAVHADVLPIGLDSARRVR